MTSLDRRRPARTVRRCVRRRHACSPSLGAADGPLALEPRFLLAAADTTPIPALFTPAPSFTTGQHIVSATVFNWFTADSGQLSGPWRPVEGRANWTGDVAFWERQLKDMMDANIDLIYVIEIPDHDPQRVNLFAAAADLRSQGYNVPKIAPFLDPVITWSIEPPIDVATTAGKDTWVAQYKKWFDEYYSVNTDAFANDYLGQMDGKPILDSWHNLPDKVANLSSLTRADVEGRLQSYYGANSIFGHGIYMVGTGVNPTFPAFTDERLAQFEVTNYYQPVTYKGITTAMVKGGYWDQNVRNPGSFLPRDGGSHYVNAWNQVNANAALTHVNVESWNEYDEGSGIYAADPGPPFLLPGSGNTNTDTWSSTGNPREYIDDTAAGARTFNATPDYGAQFLWNDLPTTMQPGETRTVSVVVRNAGDLQWTGAAQFKLGQEELKDPAVFGVGRYTIDDQTNEIPQYGGIFRGRPITFQFQLQAPSRPGVYPLHFQMVQEHVKWFGDELPVTIVVKSAQADVNGDSKTDLAIFDKTLGAFGADLSGGGTLIKKIGNPADNLIPVTSDFNGDGKVDLGVFDKTTGTFGISLSGGGSIIKKIGNAADDLVPAVGDYDGDGKVDLGIFDRTLGAFGISLSGGGTLVQPIGNKADNLLPAVGDFNGDGKADLAIFDRTLGAFGVALSGGGTLVQPIGNKADNLLPAIGDFNGDGKADFGVFDRTLGAFGVLLSGGGMLIQPIGNKADNLLPAIGDYDGDGKADFGIFDKTLGAFGVLLSGGGTLIQPIGNKADDLVPAVSGS